jgi:hypothetical protein
MSVVPVVLPPHETEPFEAAVSDFITSALDEQAITWEAVTA